jgi:hypothetical protein
LSKKGVPATAAPQFDVTVVFEEVKGRKVFHFTVTEAHGWAANGVYVELRHVGLPEKTGKGMSADRRVVILCDKAPLRFDQPLEHTATVQAHEIPELDSFGTSENWRAAVSHYSDLTQKKP